MNWRDRLERPMSHTQTKVGAKPRAKGTTGTGTKLVVASIDFGTTYSGYAYSFRSDYQSNHLKVYANQAWSADGEGLVTMKAPTIVLFDRDDKFHSFGFEAEKKYMDLAVDEKHVGWKYFRRFKMSLNKRLNLKRTMTLEDDQNKKKPAKTVFAAAIAYLKNHLLERIQQSVEAISATDIFWILTVPAIWHDGARQFMMESAYMAGIPNGQLTLALEPECAAIFCKEISVDMPGSSGSAADLTSFNPGAQFMVVDLGADPSTGYNDVCINSIPHTGGTVDITVHEVEDSGNLREISVPSGGPWGGTTVDTAFEKFLTKMFTEPVIQAFEADYKDDQLELQIMFELKKRAYKKGDETVVMRMPRGLFEAHSELCKTDFQTSISVARLAEKVRKKRDKLLIDPQMIDALFEEPKTKVIAHLQSLLSQYAMRGVSTLLLVGGFAESHVMSDAIKEAFPSKRVIIPSEAGLAVVKGAVMYGHNMDSISTRRMPYTIGISTAIPFNNRSHPDHKKVIQNGQEKCEDVFNVFIMKDREVVRGKTVVQHKFNCPAKGAANVEIYRSSEPEPRFVTDEGCKRVGSIQLLVGYAGPDHGTVVDVQMMFGGTQIEVKAKEHDKTDWGVDAKIDFLR